MTTGSLQRRLIGILLISQLLLTALLTLAAIAYFRHSLMTAFDSELGGRALALAALVRYAEDGTQEVVFDKDRLPSLLRSPTDVCGIRTERRIVYLSPGWHDLQLGAGGPRSYETLRHQGTDYRVVQLKKIALLDEPDEDGAAQTVTVTYGSAMFPVTRRVFMVTVAMIAVGIFFCAITAVLGMRAVRRSLNPLKELAAAAGAVSARQWRFQIPASVERTDELKPLANSLAQTLERLRSSFRQQEEFIANAAHELKTPVAILKSCLQGLEHQSHSIEEFRTGVADSLEDVDRIGSLIAGMLSLARLEQLGLAAGRGPAECVDLCETCASAATRMQSLARDRGIVLEVHLDGPLAVCAVAEDLEMAWMNLIENAICYSPAGSTVTMAARRNGLQTAEITVRDAGIGIPAEDLPHIFERFYRVDRSRARNTGGTGLGLAITKAVVESYGGQISVISELGHGTCVRSVMPLQDGGDGQQTADRHDLDD
jgi:signal transduction histidine kinase